MKFFDDKIKKVYWMNKNYFFAGTVVIVALNILLFAFLGNHWETRAIDIDIFSRHWGDVFYFDALVRTFLNSFSHSNWQHVLLNMLCFLGCGLYLERKTGSISLFFLIIAFAFFTSTAISANNLSVNWHGFSGVNYGLYFYIAIDYIFSFQKAKRNKFNTIFGAVILALIYLAMCFSGGTTEFSFTWYPYDLLHNLAHYSGAIAGIFLGLTVQIVQLKTRKEIT